MLFQRSMRNRLRDDGLLMMKAARESDTRCDDDSANNQKPHDSTPIRIFQ
jgi:hypothetical protein